MVKFKSTTEVLKIIKNKEQIRNFSVIAHVDHGKTTMSDSLLAASGIIAPSAAGKALAMDFDKEEQARGITIYQANVTLHITQKNKEYVINMIDTPGHVDFSGRVIRSTDAKPEADASGLADVALRMLMTHLVSKVPDQRVHFVFQLQFFLLQSGFVDQILFRKEMVGLELL